jgi:hypothetical protein
MAGSHGHPRGQDGQGTGQATSLQEPCGKGNDHALDIHTQSLREAGIAVLSLGGSEGRVGLGHTRGSNGLLANNGLVRRRS